MSFKFCSLSSGSSGNCYIAGTDTTAVIVDAGISGKRIIEGIKTIGLSESSVKALLVTHEHTDHVKSVRVLSRKMPFLNVYATDGTWDCICECVSCEKQRIVFPGEEFTIGDITVRPFSLSHDAAEPVGYTLLHDGCRISIVTDTGVVTEEIHNEIKDADILILEANHDVHTLHFCRYPYSTKLRILGEYGHLSNDAAAEELCRICREGEPKMRQVLLAHLSRENNFPEMAYQTVKNVLEENGIYIGSEIKVDVIERDKISPIYTVKGKSDEHNDTLCGEA